MKNHLLLMMGGSGTRLGADKPKQYIEVEDIPIFAYILYGYSKMKEIDNIVIVSHKDWIEFVKKWINKMNIMGNITIVSGGSNRSESVKNGLIELKRKNADDKDTVLIHDATHPYVDIDGTIGIIKAMTEYEGATLGQIQYDTVYEMDVEQEIVCVCPKHKVVSGASPEAFAFGRIYDIYLSASDSELAMMTSAGAIALSYGIRMKVVPANVLNLKITYKNDFEAFKKLVKAYFFEDM